MISTLRRKFIIITMALVSFVLVAVSVGIYLFYTSNLRSEGYTRLSKLVESPNEYQRPNMTIGGLVPEDYDDTPIFIAYINAGQAILVSSDRFDVDQEDLSNIMQHISQSGESMGEIKEYSLRYMIKETMGGYIMACMSLTSESTQTRGLGVMLVLLTTCTFLIFLAASLFLSRWAFRPVEHAWEQQRRFVADASHELKTPLTVILANTGILKSHPEETVAKQMAWVDNTEEEARRMKELVENMLFLAKSDDALQQLPLAPVNLRDVAAASALAFEPVAFEQGLSLDIDMDGDAMVLGSDAQLRQLVGILLDNAAKYGQRGTAITVRLKRQQKEYELAVHNHGPAISPDDQKHLFERFYRADPSRTSGGYGLGLSIAKSIAERHKGRIALASNSGGTTFTVLIPALD